MQSMTTASSMDDETIARLLAAARETIANVRYCWLATRAEEGGAHARAVRAFAGLPDDDDMDPQVPVPARLPQGDGAWTRSSGYARLSGEFR
jgi:hypothetical protein